MLFIFKFVLFFLLVSFSFSEDRYKSDSQLELLIKDYILKNPEVIIIFGKKVCEFLEIEWEEPYKHKNFTEFAEGYIKLKNPETNKEVLYKTIYCHHLSQGYTKEGVTKTFKRVKELLSNEF